MISISEFSKLDIRAGVVKSAERVPGTSKLVRLEVDLGELGVRQLVAGIAEEYKPEDIVGKTIIVLANLEPKKIRGVLSQGMLLAAVHDDKPVLLTTDRPVPPGTKVM
ncbi:MAG: methionine--tRNA ligase subunit beta [Thermoproteota archaeon]|nr:MAG: methionine--tRNA ligase subunit beta [Candidatus Korarchaeota archaeon]RLG53570.1 MAG: methionine--tRNA ligase subunit beta [Candidatus Korarchaeota archaeon]